MTSPGAISRRRFLQAAAATLAGAGLPGCGRRTSPNLLVIVADDLRHDTLGFAGDLDAQTPFLDELSLRAVRFWNNFVTTSICATSRASLLTGQYASRHGVWSFEDSLDPAQLADTYPGRLRKAGYYTGFVGKYGIGTADGSHAPELFDVWKGFFGQGHYWPSGFREGEHLSAGLAREARGFLETAPADRPFCLSVSFKAPHVQDEDEATDPFQPDPRFLEAHLGTVFHRPRTDTPGDFARLPGWMQSSEARRRWETRFGTDEKFQDSMRKYYALVTGLDDAVGRVLAALDATGRREDTVVVFTSDNGFLLGEHGLAGKWYGFEESIRTPLLIELPGGMTSWDVRLPTLNIDLAPTLLDLAHAPIPQVMQGRSVRPLLLGRTPSPPWRSDWFYEHRLQLPDSAATWGFRGIPKSEGLRDSRYKYLVHYDSPPPNVMLFDLESDPDEEHDLSATADPALLARLDARLAELRAEAKGDAKRDEKGDARQEAADKARAAAPH